MITFTRFFKKQFGLTPGEYRRLSPPDALLNHKLSCRPKVVNTVQYLLARDLQSPRFGSRASVTSTGTRGSLLQRYSTVAYSLMRIVAGLLFACHGAQKLFGALG